MKETAQSIVERTPALLIILGALLLIVGAAEGLVAGTFSLKISSDIWKTIIAATGVLFIAIGLILVWKESAKKTSGKPGNVRSGLESAGKVTFLSEFPEEILSDFQQAQDALIIGNTLSRAIENYYSITEGKLQQGHKIKFLIIHPEGPAVKIAEDRVYGRMDLNRRISSTQVLLGDLCKLKSTAPDPDKLEIRTIRNPLGYGTLAVNLGSSYGKIYVENYPFKMPGGPRPRFVLEAEEGQWFDYFKKEIYNLWDFGEEWKCTDVKNRGLENAG